MERAVRWAILGFTALLFLFFGLYFVVAIPRELAGLPQERLVANGIQQITLCDTTPKHKEFAFRKVVVPGMDEGNGYVKKKGDCRVWYHVTAEE